MTDGLWDNKVFNEEFNTLFYDVDPCALFNIPCHCTPKQYIQRGLSQGPSVVDRKKIILQDSFHELNRPKILDPPLDGNRSWAVVALYSKNPFVFQIGPHLMHNSEHDGPLYHYPVFPALAKMHLFKAVCNDQHANIQVLLIESIIPHYHNENGEVWFPSWHSPHYNKKTLIYYAMGVTYIQNDSEKIENDTINFKPPSNRLCQIL